MISFIFASGNITDVQDLTEEQISKFKFSYITTRAGNEGGPRQTIAIVSNDGNMPQPI